ncbi:hypothetical protein [Microbacterium lacticum]|uniref:hypothetical protein n=1 Tax=Microbacterium lacticum TaxID=33885 RepID=UPI0018B0D655|nr:hypothetical protein [Microbacterium lacticum]MBF9335660.1 hypothetical protein [Microbacterium lacticum]
MGTVHSRIQVTPDDELVAAIARAAVRWPEASRSELVRRLALEGDRSGAETAARAEMRRREGLRVLASLDLGLGVEEELAELRSDWRR